MLAVRVDWDLFSRYQDAMTPMTLFGVVIAIATAGWLVFRLRARFREDSGRADEKLEMLSQFRELRQQGELTEDEFRLIKSRLSWQAAGQLNATPTRSRDSAKHAEAGLRGEGGSEKTGETGRDDTDPEQSRSTDEPPNESSTSNPDGNDTGKTPD